MLHTQSGLFNLSDIMDTQLKFPVKPREFETNIVSATLFSPDIDIISDYLWNTTRMKNHLCVKTISKIILDNYCILNLFFAQLPLIYSNPN